jgi:hypothetical protein
MSPDEIGASHPSSRPETTVSTGTSTKMRDRLYAGSATQPMRWIRAIRVKKCDGAMPS